MNRNKIIATVGGGLAAATLIACGAGSSKANSPVTIDKPTTSVTVSVSTSAVPTTTTRQLTVDEQNAIRSAQSYLSFTAFSRKGLIKQLSSDAGEGFSVKTATFAVDYLRIDFNEQAYKSAQSYLQMSGYSRAGLLRQLESDAGEGFTHAQATYAVDKLGL
jgi:hypothetical protein